MDAGSEDNPQEVECSKLKEPQGSKLHKICRRGDKIYQRPNENITMINKKFPNVENKMPKISHVDESVKVDDIQSGESLFKTFTFDQKISKEETEKCISFWRSVVEKNLEPIKCTLIENTKIRMDAATQKRSSTNSKPRKKSTSITNKDSIESQASKGTEKGRSKWNEILLELQKKKIAETKLHLEKKCRFCGYLNSPPYETPDPKQQNKEMIAELDDWKPKSCRQIDLKFVKKGSRSNRSSVSSKRKSLSSDPAIIKETPGLETVLETEDEIKERHMESVNKKLEQIRIASLDIKHVDLIAEKKKKGLYSQWRKNNLATCECDRMNCDCNTNPAIKSITLGNPTLKKQRRSSVSSVSKGTAASKQHNNAILFDPKTPDLNTIETPVEVCSKSPDFLTKQTEQKSNDSVSIASSTRDVPISEDGLGAMDDQSSDEAIIISQSDNISQTGSASVYFQIPRKSILLLDDEDRQRSKSFVPRKSLSVMIKCTCSYEKCDCKDVIKIPQKSAFSEEEIPIPKPPKIGKSLQRVNSFELIKRKFSSVSAVPDAKVFSKSELSRNRSKSVDSLELVRRRLSKVSTYKEEDDEHQHELVPRARAVSITFKV